MRSGRHVHAALALALLVAPGSLAADGAMPVHRTRYAMGTMFDVVAYHESAARAERAVTMALDEIVRLDRVLSHFKADSDLSRLNREGADGFVRVDPSLYDVIRQSIELSAASAGRFDVTIAPLLRLWKETQAEGRTPSAGEVAAARACVGSSKVETSAPDRIRFRHRCVEIDLGGIGKGYAVDRALAVLAGEGIENALVNAGASSIGAIGSPPGRSGWPVRLAESTAALELHDESISTSQQALTAHAFAGTMAGDIIDPRIGGPAEERRAVTVRARSATLADALSTTLLLCSREEGRALLARFPNVSATWTPDSGHHAHVP